ncbi:MAG: hypothetical protein CMF52_07325 [Legionellales bacterium]|nr:hypothetical protein [Legionellales bacterium]
MKKQEVTNLIKETIENKLFEHKLKQEVDTIYESRQDLQSVMLLSMMEELSGRKIPDPTVLDEGVWEKAKAMLAKIRLSKSTGASQQRDALEAAADKAANKKFSEMLGQLKQAPGFDKYPNNEKEEEFVGITTGIGIMYQSVVEAHKDGLIETDTANDLVSKLKGYVDGLEGDLSYSYRYFNEDEDADGDDVLEEEEEDELNERAFTNFNRATKLLKLAKDGEIKPFQMRKLNRIRKGLEKEFARRGGTKGMTNKEKDLLGKFSQNDDVFKSFDAKGRAIPDAPAAPQPAAPGGGGGGGGGGGSAVPNLGTSQIGPGGPSVSNIGGVQDLGKLYKQAGSVSTLSSWLGPGFLKSVAGFALPVAGIAGITALVAKRLMGKSREGSLKKLSGVLAPVQANDQGTEAPVAAGGEDPQASLGGGEDPQASLGGAGAAAAGAGGAPEVKTVNSSNLATRDADGTSKNAAGQTVFDEPQALALAKAQVAWLTANPGTSPAQKNGRAGMKRDLEAAIAASADTRERGDIPDDRISDDELTGGKQPPGRAAANPLAETVNRWQQIAGIIKG